MSPIPYVKSPLCEIAALHLFSDWALCSGTRSGSQEINPKNGILGLGCYHLTLNNCDPPVYSLHSNYCDFYRMSVITLVAHHCRQETGFDEALRVAEPPFFPLLLFLPLLPPPSCSRFQLPWTPFHFRTTMSLYTLKEAVSPALRTYP